MAEGGKRRRVVKNPDDAARETPSVFDASLSTPLTPAEKRSWDGFCEIESEPALFNVMLREFGAKGIKVQEVVSLDPEMLQFLNKPIYGLIFLFRWKEPEADTQEAICPDDVWFANQTVHNACATISLLNIVNNVPEHHLGEELRSFKHFTKDFTPALRGDAVGNFEFVKHIHNSFARKMDVFNCDMVLKNEATAKRNQKSASKATAKSKDPDESESAFHFIAFVPVNGRLWELDGLKRQPENLGAFEGDEWLNLAAPKIQGRMAEYEDNQIEFSVLSVAKDPLIEHVAQLNANFKSLRLLNRNLSPEQGRIPDDGTVLGPDTMCGSTETDIDQTQVEPFVQNLLEPAKNSNEELERLKNNLIEAQMSIRASILEEQQLHEADEQYAAGRRHDYSPAVLTWLRLLARKEMVAELAEGGT